MSSRAPIRSATRNLEGLGEAQKDADGEVVKLTIFGKALTDSDMEGVTKLPKLRELVLQECTGLTNQGWAWLDRAPLLSTIAFIGVPISDEGLGRLQNSRTLRELTLARTQVTGVGLGHLQQTPLARLVIKGRGMTPAGLQFLSRLSSLRELELQCPDIRLDDVPSLTRLTNLESFVAPGTVLGPAGFECLRGHTNLKVLTLNSDGVVDSSVDVLNTLTSLEQLEISNANVTDEGLKRLVLPKLKRLSLGGCSHVTDAVLPHLSKLSALEVLEIYATAVTGRDLSALSALHSLRKVLISGNQFKGDQKTLDALRKRLPDCEVVIMRG